MLAFGLGFLELEPPAAVEAFRLMDDMAEVRVVVVVMVLVLVRWKRNGSGLGESGCTDRLEK